jgi:hypothetical protein
MDPKDRKIIHQKTARETNQDAIARSEKELQEQIASLLRRHDIPYIRPAMFKKSSLPKGWPDFTFAHEGIPYAWECKIPGKEPTQEQLNTLIWMTNHGWAVSVIISLQQAQNILLVRSHPDIPREGLG